MFIKFLFYFCCMCLITFAILSIGDFWVSFWVSFCSCTTFQKFTDDIKKKTVDGVHEAIKNRPQDIGNTHETLAKYRDGMLVEILRLHKDYKI